MSVFTDDILKRCQREIDDQTNFIEQQGDLSQVMIARGKAHFIKVMVLLQDEPLIAENVKKSIDALRKDGGDNPSPAYRRMIGTAQSYYDAVYELFD
jgi:hypothetical protein